MRRPPMVTAPFLVFSAGLSSSVWASALASPALASPALASSALAAAGVGAAGAARASELRVHATAARTARDQASFCIAATLARRRDASEAESRGLHARA